MEENPKLRDSGNEGLETGNTERYPESNGNKRLIIGLIAVLILTSLVILSILLSGTSDYEKGMQYLHQKQYSEALVEFQKVEPGDKSFTMSQSKINYINGVQSFNNGLYPQAQVYLAKVDAADEYYRESQLMLDKMNVANRQGGQESLTDKIQNTVKDTVIIREKIVEPNSDKVKQAEPNVQSNQNTSKAYVGTLESKIDKFKELHTTAISANADLRFKTMRLMDSIYSETEKLAYTSREGNASVMELKIITTGWMKKTMTYLNSLNPENSVGGESNTSKYKDEADREYTLMTNLLEKIKSAFSM